MRKLSGNSTSSEGYRPSRRLRARPTPSPCVRECARTAPSIGVTPTRRGRYYNRHVGKQSAKKALGYYQSTGGTPVFQKIQIPAKYTGDEYEFEIPEELRLSGDESDMSDIES